MGVISFKILYTFHKLINNWLKYFLIHLIILYISVKIVRRHVMFDVQRHPTRVLVWCIATNVVRNVCVYHQEHTEIKKNVLAITTGRPKKVDQNVHNCQNIKRENNFISSYVNFMVIITYEINWKFYLIIVKIYYKK